MQIFIAVIFLSIVLTASAAQACICTKPTPETIERMKSNTAYAGVVEVLDIKKKRGDTTIFYLDSVLRNAGDLGGKFKIVKTYEDSCDWAPNKKGFYEVIISRHENQLHFAGRCWHMQNFMQYFSDAPTVLRHDYLTEVEVCRESGSEWRKEGNRLSCIHETKDGMK